MKLNRSILLESIFLAASAVDVAPSEFLPSSDAQTGDTNGIWTGYDWANTTAGIGVKNGVPYGLND